MLFQVVEPTSEPWLTLHYDEWMCAAPAASSRRHVAMSSLAGLHFAVQVLKGRLACALGQGVLVFAQWGQCWHALD